MGVKGVLEYKISDGLRRMDFKKVTSMLSNSYWTPGIKIGEVKQGHKIQRLSLERF